MITRPGCALSRLRPKRWRPSPITAEISATPRPLEGVIAAVPTPVTPDGRPDIGRFLQHCEWALANGCDGLNVLGTTGEATSLGPAMRREIMAAAAGALPRDKLMVGTGMPDLETTVALTRTAEELGFAAALVL